MHNINEIVNAFPDHFSGVASGYSEYRPHYPASLFDALASIVGEPDSRDADGATSCGNGANTVVWDCASGTGQASVSLGERFPCVLASDASASQVRQAARHPNVYYAVGTAEHCPLASGSVALLTVAQALHWFRIDEFYREAKRVLRPGGVIAVWCYGLLRVDENPDVERVIDDFMEVTLGGWWPPERRHVDAGYTDLPFPFTPIPMPEVDMRAEWTLPQLLGYLRTWSAVSQKRAFDGADPVKTLEPQLAEAWGLARGLWLRWPVAGRVGSA